MNNVTEKTHGMVQRWIAAKKQLRNARTSLNSAECELANANNELGKWLVPENQPDGEMFNIWFGSGILQAQKLKGCSNYDVSWRREPDGKDRHEFGV